jgi:hypothetical protein
MSEKSHVGMGFQVCPVTGHKHSESILLDKNMQDRIDKENFLGYSYSPEVVEKIKEGYVCLIEVNNITESADAKQALSLKDADRTGTYCFIKKELAADMFGIKGEVQEIQFVSSEVITFLTDLKLKSEDGSVAEEPEV